jgi:predicted nucleic acid-binding protein
VILVDTSVWVDHFNRADARFADLLDRDLVVTHPFVVGELALGHLRQRESIINTFRALPQATMAQDDEVLDTIERFGLAGSGIGYVDAHLLTATRLTHDCRLWTRDKRLDAVAVRLNLAARILH